MWRTSTGSTGRLVQLCVGYFAFYVLTGVLVRYFQYYPQGPRLSAIQYLIYSTAGGVSVPFLVVLIARWYKFKSIRTINIKGFSFPSELLYIGPSGFCTAIIVAFTTLMYSIKGVSVMVAMVLMRASVIVISRIVDAIQIRQKILTKKVYFAENMGVFFALIAVFIKMFWGYLVKGAQDFNFITHPAAMTVLCTYIAAYALRIYIMNYFKNTRPKTGKYDSKAYFAIEQIISAIVLFLIAVAIFYWPVAQNSGSIQIEMFHNAIAHPHRLWFWAMVAGVSFGIVSFFSVFIFLFKGRTATFAGLVNRLTSLVAGTAATLIFWYFFGGGFPGIQDWLSLIFIIAAIGFMSAAEKKRARELLADREIEKKS